MKILIAALAIPLAIAACSTPQQSAGTATGVAAGAVVGGPVGAVVGGVAGAGLMLIISALFVRAGARGRRIADLPEPTADAVAISRALPGSRPAAPAPRRAASGRT